VVFLRSESFLTPTRQITDGSDTSDTHFAIFDHSAIDPSPSAVLFEDNSHKRPFQKFFFYTVRWTG